MAARILLCHVQAEKAKHKQPFITRTGVKNLDNHSVNIDWFIAADSSSLCRLQNTAAAERKNDVPSIIFLPLSHVFWFNVASRMTGMSFKKVGQLLAAKRSIKDCGDLSSPVIFGFLLPVQTCVFSPCHVLSCPFLALGKGDIFTPCQSPSKSEYTVMFAMIQKNAVPLQHAWFSGCLHHRGDVFLHTNTYSHPQRTSLCRNRGWQVVWHTSGLMVKTCALVLYAYNSSSLVHFLTLWFVFLVNVIPLCYSF